MSFQIYQIDAFTDEVFKGNPAAVVPLPNWFPDETLQKIAFENNLSETAFIVFEAESIRIRWFTPNTEVDLCGHATLATAFYLFDIKQIKIPVIEFSSRSGILKVEKKNDLLVLDFPAMAFSEAKPPVGLMEGIGAEPIEIYKAKDDWMLVFEDEKTIEKLTPNFSELKKVEARGIIVTAPSSQPNIDFVSRFFAPAVGINEDPVTGSAHTKLVPYWSKKLNKNTLVAKQISERTGVIFCENAGDRVKLGGKAMLYLKGEIFV